MKSEHYIKYISIFLIGIALAVASCKEEDKSDMIDISLDKNDVVLKVGMTETLKVIPDISVEWSSTNTEVVTVENGVITAVGLGNAKINAQVGRSLAFCEVAVIDEPIDVTGVTITISDTILAVGDQIVLESVVLPDSATFKNVKWSSSNPEIVAIDDLTGEITAIALGQAIITVTTVDGEKTAASQIDVWPSLLLNRPFENAIASLNPVDPGNSISFSWIPFEGTSDYILKISTTEEFENVILEKEISGSNIELSSYEINELVRDNSISGAVLVYWTVQPGEQTDVLGETRSLQLIPDRHEYLTLLPESATNITVSEGEGEYQYSLNAGSGESYVSTNALADGIPSDSNMFSMNYKSNDALSSIEVVFYKSDGTEAGSIVTTEIAQSSDWNELSFAAPQVFSEFSWGGVGDYLTLNIDDAWQGEVNGIHFRGMSFQEKKDNYIPQILTITGSNQMELTSLNETHYQLITTGTDPNFSTSKLEADLPSGANTLTFEYKSTKVLSNNLQIFAATPTQGLAESRSFKLGTVDPASDWTVYEVDLSSAIEGWEWGVAGSFLRMDTGEQPDYDMEIRNIKVVYKE